MIQVVVDGQTVSVPEGSSLWEAAHLLGIRVPVLCHDPRLRPVGVCRVCVVELSDGKLVPACCTPARDGIAFRTDSESVERHRLMLLRLLLATHRIPCLAQQKLGNCSLERLGQQYGLLDATGRPSDQQLIELRSLALAEAPVDDSSPTILVDHAACILCDRCTRACNEVQCNDVIGKVDKGFEAHIAFDLAVPIGRSSCVSCGECVQACPTGALMDRRVAEAPGTMAKLEVVSSVCPYCGVGCTVDYLKSGNRIVAARGRPSPGSDARLCVKGRYGWDYVLHPHRLTKPLVRRPEYYPKGPLTADTRGDGGGRRKPGAPVPDYEQALAAFREATWDEALDLIAERLQDIRRRYGTRALAGFGSAKCSNEEAYLFQKLVRAGFGNNNVDHCTRLCHASSVAALLECIGSGAVTNVFRDVDRTELILVTGSNTVENHPVAATFFKQAVRRGKRLLVVDPRRPRLADYATWYCQIQPGSDVAFYNALMHVIVRDELYDESFVRARVRDFDSFWEVVREYAPQRAAPLCGIPAAQLEEIAHAIGKARAMMVFWGMGISQHTHGTDNARCLIALCLLTGNVGRPGTGLHPLRGQNNVQGASDAGLIPMVFPDYQPVSDPGARQRFEQAWGVRLDPEPGLTVVEVMNAALAGEIRGMLMMGENPFLSDPNVNKVREALATLDFLAVQDIFLTETAEFADVVLPSASFFEKLGTYTNTDRRVQLGRPVLGPPGDARPDWQILADLLQRFGLDAPYESPEQIFREFADLTRSYRGLSYQMLGLDGKIWPIPHPDADEKPILFDDSFPTPDGKGRLVGCRYAPPAELPDSDFPFVLNTGRMLEHWHTGTMTRRSEPLDALAPEAYVELNSDDAEALGIDEGSYVRVTSRRGAVVLRARPTDRVAQGCVFIPFHFREAAANLLTIDELDPYGKIPEYKFCAVRVEPTPPPPGPASPGGAA